VRQRQKRSYFNGCGISFLPPVSIEPPQPGDIFFPFIVEKAQRSGFFDSLTGRLMAAGQVYTTDSHIAEIGKLKLALAVISAAL
jgi:hypothetical protein